MSRTRTLSYSEIDTALSCFARHGFSYTGRLTDGETLKPRGIAPILSDGRAWGAAVAAWHAGSGTLLAEFDAMDALRASLNADAAEIVTAGGMVDPLERDETERRLISILEHYCSVSTPFGNLSRVEEKVVVGLPSRSGGPRASSTYKFGCFIDGYTIDTDGRQWIVEVKLRRRLQAAGLIAKSRQIRWYAWALTRAQDGHEPFGVIVDERWNEAPKPPRVLADGALSHAKAQLCTADGYQSACFEHGEEPREAVVEALGARVWQKRTPIIFRAGELAEAGRELVSAAKLIRSLDSGEIEPIRHATAMTCGFCRFEPICENPSDHLYVDTLFTRHPPKREREKEAA